MLRPKLLTAEITRQFEAFAAAFGRPPDFVDGHHHVHLFPQIRDAVPVSYTHLDVYKRQDYYTGFVFELHDPRGKSALVAGGRYDGLLSRLGARAPIPAVGFAASIEELTACGGAA